MARRTAVITIVVVLLLSWGGALATVLTSTRPLLGLDLQGGFAVVLEAPAGTGEDVLEKAVEIMRSRIEALGGVQEPQIQVRDDSTIEVQLPGVTDRDRALAAVGRTGQLEFRPVLSTSPQPGVSPLAYQALLDTSLDEEPDLGGEDLETIDITDLTTTTLAGTETTTADPGDDTSTTLVEDTTTTTQPEDTTTTTEPPAEGEQDEEFEIPAELLPAGLTFFEVGEDGVAIASPGCVDRVSGFTVETAEDLPAFLLDPATGEAFEVDVARVLGSDLSNAQAVFQQTGGGGAPLGVGGGGGGSWVVLLDFNSAGAQAFEEVTRELVRFPVNSAQRRFAIVLDGFVQSAPGISAEVGPEGITGGSAVITLGAADNQQAEASELAIVLRYGALPVAFDQPSVDAVSATLGADSLNAGLIAGLGGLVLVAAAMIAYYRALGIVNVIGLTVFGSLMWVAYAVLGATQGVTLTLAGVAGVIVAVGITSDSYIVYYERIKEEVRHGRSLRSAIDHAFRRSFRTILTADTVSLVGAFLLFLLAIGSVRGFALALGLATITDVFVAYFFTRPAVALVARSRLGEGGTMSIRGAAGRAVEEPA
jgi:preprotein translocase subunit SecD